MATVSQVTEAVFRSRFEDQMSAGAEAARQAVERLGVQVAETDQRVTRSERSARGWVSSADEVTQAARRAERAKRDLASAERALANGLERGEVTSDQAARALATLGTRARQTEERLRALQRMDGVGFAGVTQAANDAGVATGNLGQRIGQAGFQIQDFAAQLAGGTSALVALGQQGSQFLGMFGPAGAAAGATLAVGALAAQFLLGRDNAEALNDAVEAQDDLFKEAKEASEEYRQSLEDQVETARELTDAYRGLTDELREFEARRLQVSRNQLEEQLEGIRGAVLGGGGGIERALGNLQQMFDAQGRVGDVPQAIRDAASALIEFRSAGNASAEDMAALATRLRTAIDNLPERARAVRDVLTNAVAEIDAQIPNARRAGRSIAQNDQMARALSGRLVDVTPPEFVPPEVPEGGGDGGGRASGRDLWDPTRTQLALDRHLEDTRRGWEQLQAAIDPTTAALRQYQQHVETINQARAAGIATEADYATAMDRTTKALDDQIARINGQVIDTDRLGHGLGMTFASAFEDAIVNGRKFSDVLKAIEQDLARMIIRMSITAPLARAISGGIAGIDWGGMFGSSASAGASWTASSATASNNAGGFGFGAPYAKGGAFGPSGIIPFADGGIVDRPTLFGFAGGTGLMGEAGPEAIMPLKRGPDGKLGVAGGGGGTVVNQTISIDARGAEAGVDAKLRALVPAIIAQANAQLLADIQRGGAVAKVVGRRRG
jgi:plasmid stabilization system protein ParE